MSTKFLYDHEEFSTIQEMMRYARLEPGAEASKIITYRVRKDLHLSHTNIAHERVPGLVAQIIGLIDDLAQEINPQKEEELTVDEDDIIRFAVLQRLEQCYPTIEVEEERHTSLRRAFKK